MAFKNVNFEAEFHDSVGRASRGVSHGLDYMGQGLEIVGVDNAVRRLELLGAKVLQASIISSAAFARLVLFRSLKNVPFDEGFTFESGEMKRVHDKGNRRYIYEVSYGKSGPSSDYALTIHENTRGVVFRAGKGPFPNDPKTSHWLTNALEVSQAEFPSMVKGEIINHIKEAVEGRTIIGMDMTDDPKAPEAMSWEDVLKWEV